MGFSLAPFKRGLPLAAIAALGVCSAQPQRSGLHGGQPILFSSPTADTTLSNTPSLSPKPPESLDLSEASEAPLQMQFNRLPEALPLPSVMPLLTPGEAERERDLDDRRRNWALMTPAEILGIVTPEQILGVSERDAFGQPKYPTALERYADRQTRLLLLAKTNAAPSGSAPPAWYFLGDRRDEANSPFGTKEPPDPQASSRLNAPLNNPFYPFSARQNDNSGWSKLFDNTPFPVAPMPSAAQVEDMERFRQLLNPGSPSPVTAATPGSGGLKTSLPQALLGSGLAQSPNRLGGSFTPLTSGIGRPAELPKLTPTWGLSYTSPPPAEAWAPQPPPWLSPSPFTAPQRKF